MDDLDRRLRALASESLDRAAVDLPVDADLATVRERAAERSDPEPGHVRARPWARLAVAATIALLVAGAVTVLATRDRGEDVVAPASADAQMSTIPGQATTPPSTIGPVTTSAPAPAVAEPSTVGAGGSVSITPSSEVLRTCLDIVSVALRTDHDVVPVGLITPSGWDTTTPSTIPACEGVRTSDPLQVRVPDVLEHGEYRFCIAGDDTPEGCAIVVVASVTTTTAAATSTTTTVGEVPGTVPGGYFERVVVDAAPYFEIRELAPDGSVVGALGDDDITALLRREVPVGDDGSIRLLAPEEPYGRCDDRRLEASGPSAGAIVDLIGPVRSIASADGVVIVGIDVCPEGAQWGDDGTRFELRRVDLTTGSTTVLHVREPGDGDTFFADRDVVYAGGDFVVESVSSDGAYVAVAEPYSTEDTRHHVIDAVTGGEPIAFGSACDDPRDLVGPPQFVGDGLVVLARECSPAEGEIGDLIVELVALATREPVWSVDVVHVAIDSYSHTVSLSADAFEGGVWALVSGSAGVEQPIRAAAVTDRVELPLPVDSIVAFTPEELIESWDPQPA